MAQVAEKLSVAIETPKLEVHDNPIPKGLLEIRAMRKHDKHSPEHVYTNLLNDKERQALTFFAKFQRTELGKPWCSMTVGERQDIRQALMFLNNIVLPFIEANAMEPYKFIQAKNSCH